MQELVPLLLFTSSSALTPGPNNFMIMNSGLSFGIKNSLPHYFGICFGFPMMVLIMAFGFGAIFQHHLWIEQVFKVIGSLYMLYLALHILRFNNNSNKAPIVKPLGFMQALIFQWVNPKAWLMAIGAISIFTLTNNYIDNAILISVTFLLMCIPCSGAWLFFGTFLQRIIKKDKHRRWFNKIMASLLIASIALIFLD